VSDFPHPLDEWITEEREQDVLVPILDKKGNVQGLEKKKQTVIQKIQYTQAVDKTIDCGNFKHFWTIPDPHVHTAFCNNCSKRRMIRAVFEKVVDGKILNRDTDAWVF
jgi:hypothetical protein